MFASLADAHNQRALAAMAADSEWHTARLRSVSGWCASGWLQAIPCMQPLYMPPEEFRTACKLRLGMIHPQVSPIATCMCGASPDLFGTHYMACKIGNQRSIRHDHVAATLKQMLLALGHVARVNGLQDLLPVGPAGEARVVDVYGAAGPLMAKAVAIDVAVVHPVCDSYVKAAAATSRATAAGREEIKMAKYGQACDNVGISFIPAVFESYGTAGEIFEGWFKKVMKAKDKIDKEMGSNKVSWTAHTSGAYWQQRLSVALQRGNAKMVHRRGARDSTDDTA